MTIMKIALCAAALILPALPATAAQSLGDTHERVWNQAGKSPSHSYRPVARSGCKAVAPIHIAGKTPVPMHAQSRIACANQAAKSAR